MVFPIRVMVYRAYADETIATMAFAVLRSLRCRDATRLRLLLRRGSATTQYSGISVRLQHHERLPGNMTYWMVELSYELSRYAVISCHVMSCQTAERTAYSVARIRRGKIAKSRFPIRLFIFGGCIVLEFGVFLLPYLATRLWDGMCVFVHFAVGSFICHRQ